MIFVSRRTYPTNPTPKTNGMQSSSGTSLRLSAKAFRSAANATDTQPTVTAASATRAPTTTVSKATPTSTLSCAAHTKSSYSVIFRNPTPPTTSPTHAHNTASTEARILATITNLPSQTICGLSQASTAPSATSKRSLIDIGPCSSIATNSSS